MRLSIVICVYNTDRQYLSECLDSITDSTLWRIGRDYEICIVDDGSDKDYSDIAKKYGARIKKTENRGIYSARATGLYLAKGNYTCFCDSDDTVSHDFYLPMLEAAESDGCDVVINGWASRTPRAAYYPSGDETITAKLELTGKEKLEKFFEHEGRYHSFYVLWNKLYRTDFLKSCFKNLDASGYKNSSYGEDAAINFFAFRDAKLIKNIHTGFYFYRLHPTQSVSVTSKEKLYSQIEDMARAFHIMKVNLPENEDKKMLLTHIAKWEELMAKTHFAVAKANGYNELFRIIEEKYNTPLSKMKENIPQNKGNILLPQNFRDIDRVLFSVWKSETPISVKYSKKDAYTSQCMRRIIKAGKATYKKRNPDLIIPKPKTPLKLRIIHNPTVYKLSTRLFKKGSNTREFLKKFI